MRQHPFICTALAVMLATQLVILSSTPVQSSHGAQRNLYIVYMGELLELSEEVTKASHHSMLSSALPSEQIAQRAHIVSYSKSFNGFAAMLTPDEASIISDMAGVASVFESRMLKLHTTRSWNFLGFSSQTPRNLESEGSIVTGVMDTGIWPESESFKENGVGASPEEQGSNCNGDTGVNCTGKITQMRFYHRGIDATLAEGLDELKDYLSARDADGHGTHAAATAAGSVVRGASLYGLAAGNSTGGVPRGKIAVYKVCWQSGCSEVDILAAFDDAIHDGVHVLSLSFGDSVVKHLFTDSQAIGSFHAMKKGIIVSCSAGNHGPELGEVTNVAPWVITVAASSIDRQFYSTVVLGNNVTLKGRAINTQVPEGSYPLIYGADAGLNNLGRYCSSGSLDPRKVKGKVVVCDPSENMEQSATVALAGGIGMVIIDDSPTEIAASLFGIPASTIGMADGDTIKTYISSSSSPTAQILPTSTPTDEPAPLLASFSSRGPNLVIYPVLKPDVTAPGVNILASWSPTRSLTGEPQDTRFVKYNIRWGTSMSCPHVSGAAAYIKSFHPGWSPAAIKSALMTTAKPLDVGHPSNKDGEFGYGSGHIDPIRAIHPGLVYDISPEDYAEYLCDQGYNTTVVRMITGDETKCTQGKARMRDLNYPAVSVPVQAGSNEASDRWWEFPRTVTNVGNATSVYKAELQVPLGMKVEVSPATISFSKLNEQKTFLIRVQAPGLKASISPSMGTSLSAFLLWSDGVFSVRSPIVAWVAPKARGP